MPITKQHKTKRKPKYLNSDRLNTTTGSNSSQPTTNQNETFPDHVLNLLNQAYEKNNYEVKMARKLLKTIPQFANQILNASENWERNMEELVDGPLLAELLARRRINMHPLFTKERLEMLVMACK